jgi:hypothetical protein
METAHGEARKVVAEGGLTRDLLTYVQQRWQEQFGLIEIG